ncbi:MAG: sensor histidine kinase [Chitinophagaceae bacterium]
MVNLLQSRERLYWLLQFCGWGVLGAITVLFANIFNVQLEPRVLAGRILVICVVGFLITHVTRVIVKKSRWLEQPLERAWAGLFLAIILSASLYGVLVVFSLEYFDLFLTPEAYQLSYFQKWLAITIDNGLFIFSWLLLYYFFHYYSDNRRRQLDTLKLESTVRELELKTLKAHINPHFIFNSLNSIRALVDINPERARRAITELSNLLRSSMQNEKLQLVPLRQEMDIIRDYLALESIRFEDRLRIDLDIAEETLDLPVPPMMLQTLVENAIKHGISTRVDGGWIRIYSFKRDGNHVLEVANSGYLNSAVITAGFGLSSTQNRLQLLFGNKARLAIRQQEKEVVLCSVSIPV